MFLKIKQSNTTMKILVSFLVCALSFLSHVKCATTRLPSVAPILPLDAVKYQTKATDIVGDDLSSPGQSGPGGVLIEPASASESTGALPNGVVIESIPSGSFGTLPDGLVIEPVPEGTDLGGINIPSDGNVPVLIKDDNLLIKTSPENTDPTPEPILIKDDNLNVTPSQEESGTNYSENRNGDTSITDTTTGPSLVTKKSQEPSTPQNVNTETRASSGDVIISELVTPTLPPTTQATSVNSNNAGNSRIPQPQPLPCPDFESRYEDGKFIVTLDEGKCEMVVSEQAIQSTQKGMWAAGRFTPLHTLLTRKYRPEINFKPTTTAPTGYKCLHRTRQTGNFFVVDTVPGRCQMVIGIPALPDLKNILTQRQQRLPAWNKPRQMPTWPRRKPTEEREESESDD